MKWTVITTHTGGGTAVARITAVLRQFKTEGAAQSQPEAIIDACAEAGYISWHDRPGCHLPQACEPLLVPASRVSANR
jgi:hypothetical protein